MNRIKWSITLSIIILWLARWSEASKNLCKCCKKIEKSIKLNDYHDPVFQKKHLMKMILKYLTPKEYSHFIKTCHTFYDTSHASEFSEQVRLHYQSLISNIGPIDPKYLRGCVNHLRTPVTPINLKHKNTESPPTLTFDSPQESIYYDSFHKLSYSYIGKPPELPIFTSVRLPVMLMIEATEFGTPWITERINEWEGEQMCFSSEVSEICIGIVDKITREKTIGFIFDKSGKLIFIHYAPLWSMYCPIKDRENVFQIQDALFNRKNIVHVFYYLPSIEHSNVLTTNK